MSKPFSEREIRGQIAPLFSRHNPNGVYLANHSLGRPLDSMADDMAEYLEHWYSDLDEAWTPWLKEIEAFSAAVAGILRMPEGGSVTLKTSAGQGLRAVLGCFLPKKPRVICSAMEFDSVDFILRTYEERGLIELVQVPATRVEGAVPLFESEPFREEMSRGADLLVVSEVNFTTGQVFPDLRETLDVARSSGIRTVLDCYHSFGVLDREWPGADFAIGGSYKYVHGGPGACWLAISPQIQAESGFRPLDTGWFAKKTLFGYDRNAERAEGPRAWWESTPPVACVYQARAGLRFLQQFGVDRLRATNLQQQSQLRSEFLGRGLPIHNPAKPEGYGAFSLLPAADASGLSESLAARGIRTDARQGFLRLGPHPLNTSEEFEVVARAVKEILG